MCFFQYLLCFYFLYLPWRIGRKKDDGTPIINRPLVGPAAVSFGAKMKLLTVFGSILVASLALAYPQKSGKVVYINTDMYSSLAEFERNCKNWKSHLKSSVVNFESLAILLMTIEDFHWNVTLKLEVSYSDHQNNYFNFHVSVQCVSFGVHLSEY